MNILKTLTTVVSITAIALIAFPSTEARADGSNSYTCQKASLQLYGSETITYFDGNLEEMRTEDFPVYSLLATGCKPENTATPSEGAVGSGFFYAAEGEVLNEAGKITQKNGAMIGRCKEMDAGDGHGLVTGTGCRGVVFDPKEGRRQGFL